MTASATPTRRGEGAVYYYWSPHCSACRRFTSRLDAIDPGPVHVERIDVTADPEAARSRGVRGTPTLIAVDTSGRETGRIVGDASQDTIHRLFAAARGASVFRPGLDRRERGLRLAAAGAVAAVAMTTGGSAVLYGAAVVLAASAFWDRIRMLLRG